MPLSVSEQQSDTRAHDTKLLFSVRRMLISVKPGGKSLDYVRSVGVLLVLLVLENWVHSLRFVLGFVDDTHSAAELFDNAVTGESAPDELVGVPLCGNVRAQTGSLHCSRVLSEVFENAGVDCPKTWSSSPLQLTDFTQRETTDHDFPKADVYGHPDPTLPITKVGRLQVVDSAEKADVVLLLSASEYVPTNTRAVCTLSVNRHPHQS
jgi:hypothetical protein